MRERAIRTLQARVTVVAELRLAESRGRLSAHEFESLAWFLYSFKSFLQIHVLNIGDGMAEEACAQTAKFLN